MPALRAAQSIASCAFTDRWAAFPAAPAAPATARPFSSTQQKKFAATGTDQLLLDKAVVDELVRELRELEAELFASQLPGAQVDLPPRYLAVRSLLKSAPGVRVDDVSMYDHREGCFRAGDAGTGSSLGLDDEMSVDDSDASEVGGGEVSDVR